MKLYIGSDTFNKTLDLIIYNKKIYHVIYIIPDLDFSDCDVLHMTSADVKNQYIKGIKKL